MFRKRIDNVDAVMSLDRAKGIRSTFFVGMANGLGMCYSYESATKMVRHIAQAGFDCGVHGIAFNDLTSINAEYKRFMMCIGSGPVHFGVRNHYLRGRGDVKMHDWQAAAGYVFDSTDFEIKNPYKVNTLWEFPVCLMDASFISDRRNDLESLKATTIVALKEGEAKGLSHFTIIFHDVYYNERVYPDHKAWYDWLLDYVTTHYEICSFKEAIAELESGK